MENDTKVLCDTDDNNRHYFVKKDTNLPPYRCSQSMIITCISVLVMCLAFVMCLIVLIPYVSYTPRPGRSTVHTSKAGYQATLKEDEVMERLTSSEDQIEDVQKTLNRLMGQIDTLTGSSSKQIRPSPLPTETEGTQCKIAGATYVRWGRNECPESANLVYSGFAAGGKGTPWGATAGQVEHGGGSNYLCLTNKPHFNKLEAGLDEARGRIYGVEYRNGSPEPSNPHYTRHAYDAPCALCQTKGSRSQMIMTPSSTTCPDGWNKEYDGYLVASKWDHLRTEYVCLDRNPGLAQGIPSRPIEDFGFSYFYRIEIVTTPNGGLPAEYQSGKELACAVCTM